MSEDHLSNEIAVSAEITDTGVKAAARSRTLTSVDRLIGSVFDTGSAWLEGVAALKRAKNEGERQLIEATTKYGLERMNADNHFAQRAFEGVFKKAARAQLNKEAVVAEALADLREQPPTAEQARSGPAEISEEFMDRFERYSETATTDQLRQRWGRILASEIRKPGTFNAKVLRVTDELDAATASLFERLMTYRLRDVLIRAIMPDLSFEESMALVSAGLLVDPGVFGHSNTFGEGRSAKGEELWAVRFEGMMVTLKKSVAIPSSASPVLEEGDPNPSFGVYILTDVGMALSSILPARENEIALEFAQKLKAVLPPESVQILTETQSGKFRPIPLPQ